jgi:hypothetical protein
MFTIFPVRLSLRQHLETEECGEYIRSWPAPEWGAAVEERESAKALSVRLIV